MSAADRLRDELRRSTDWLTSVMNLVGKSGISVRDVAPVRASLRQQVYRNRDAMRAWDDVRHGGLLVDSNSTPPEEDVER